MSSYKKLSKLGSGAFATTFLVEEVGKGADASKKFKQLVMKRVPCKHMRAANAALQEVKVLLSCHHTGIVGYHDFFLDTDSDENIVICLVMEFCDGGDLWDKIANARRAHTPLEPPLVAGWLLQLVSALRYLHARSILHRDIKPENVFLTEEGVVAKLGDFGLATATEDLDQGSAKTQVGTPDYMAPEVLEGRPYAGPADVFSLGATLYAMVCSSFPKMLALHLGQGKPLDWPAAAEAMPLWKPLVERMLAIDEDARPSLDEIGVIAAGLPESQSLEGVSLQAKVAATLPVPSSDGQAAANAPAMAPPAAAAPPPIPSRPSQPCATDIRHDQLVLLWEPPPSDDVVAAYQVLAQMSGAGGFRTLLEDTKSSQPIVRLDRLSERTWYEFKVVALNATGTSPASVASQPVQTSAAPVSPATRAAQEAAAVAAAALANELHMKSPRMPDSENWMLEREDPELLARYAQCKRELLAWEAKFDKLHGRPATENDKIADLTFQGLMARYKRLKHAKRRLIRGADMHPSPRDHAGGASSSALESAAVAGAAEPQVALAPAPAPVIGASAAAAHSATNGAVALADAQSASCLSSNSSSHLPSTPARGSSRPPPADASPAAERVAKESSSRPRSPQQKSSKKGGKAKKHAQQTPQDVRSHTAMTVSMKASHPSPRALGGWDEETFD